MIITCSTLLICFCVVILTLLICLSKRQVCVFSISTLVGIGCSLAAYLILEGNLNNLIYLYELINRIFVKIRYNIDLKLVQSFTNCLLIILSFFVGFGLCELIAVNIANKIDKTQKKDKKYYWIKGLLISFNFLVFTFVLILLITDINIIYGMNGGILSFIFDIILKGITTL